MKELEGLPALNLKTAKVTRVTLAGMGASQGIVLILSVLKSNHLNKLFVLC